MIHKNVYEWFKTLFPRFADEVTEWFPNGKNSVRVRTHGNQDFVFTFKNRYDWKFETVESFIRSMKGD